MEKILLKFNKYVLFSTTEGVALLFISSILIDEQDTHYFIDSPEQILKQE